MDRSPLFDSGLSYEPLGERLGALTGLLHQRPSGHVGSNPIHGVRGYGPKGRHSAPNREMGRHPPLAPLHSLMVKRPITGRSDRPVRGSNPRETIGAETGYR